MTEDEQRQKMPTPRAERVKTNPLIGAVIDNRYQIEKVIGEGGMGTIYLATHLSLDKRMALKVLRPSVSSDEQAVERFLQEARAASAIGNSHIAQASDFSKLYDGSIYYVMDYLDGEDLADRLAQKRKLSFQSSIAIALQICEGLGAAHARGIIHRDLKPENIFLAKMGASTDFVKILDFGIAKAVDRPQPITGTGEVFGTPHYMSPEQAQSSKVDARSDVYSLGVLMFEMVTGKLPFDGPSVILVAEMHLKYPPPRPSQHVPSIPQYLEDVILKCLNKAPDDRYQSMAQLASDLRRVEDGLEPKILRDSERPVAKFKTTLAPLTILFVTVALFAVALWWQDQQREGMIRSAPRDGGLSLPAPAPSEPTVAPTLPEPAQKISAQEPRESATPTVAKTKAKPKTAPPKSQPAPDLDAKPSNGADEKDDSDQPIMDPWKNTQSP